MGPMVLCYHVIIAGSVPDAQSEVQSAFLGFSRFARGNARAGGGIISCCANAYHRGGAREDSACQIRSGWLALGIAVVLAPMCLLLAVHALHLIDGKLRIGASEMLLNIFPGGEFIDWIGHDLLRKAVSCALGSG